MSEDRSDYTLASKLVARLTREREEARAEIKALDDRIFQDAQASLQTNNELRTCRAEAAALRETLETIRIAVRGHPGIAWLGTVAVKCLSSTAAGANLLARMRLLEDIADAAALYLQEMANTKTTRGLSYTRGGEALYKALAKLDEAKVK